MREARQLFEEALRATPADDDPARRAAALPTLYAAVDHRRRRRRDRHAAIVLLAVLALVAVGFRSHDATTPSGSQPAPRPDPLARFALPTRADVLRRTALILPSPSRVRLVRDHDELVKHALDDAGLRAWLTAAGRPAGTVRTADRLIVAALELE